MNIKNIMQLSCSKQSHPNKLTYRFKDFVSKEILTLKLEFNQSSWRHNHINHVLLEFAHKSTSCCSEINHDFEVIRQCSIKASKKKKKNNISLRKINRDFPFSKT
ncbi:hypothetical protein BpHYR1_036202 [Brachionus plicatilis]|uniref:Uncharacterized protein n=1 Tax=Brachionus plicatilis TaxID=10195 RepID=A0A3M7RK94_BRAPC|nr:hypothetical protein BpHYR1_036202 [Brachionus plicatilis]